MTVSAGNKIIVTNYNALAGVTGSAAASSAAATNVAGYLWGVGYADRGYGQASPALTAKTTASKIEAQQWLDLRSTISSLASWQNTSQASLPTASAFSAGAQITAANTNAVETLLATCDTNRFNYVAGNMTLISSAITSTRSTTWGSSTSGITCTLQVSFASEDAARYFFNTSGDIRIALAHPSTSTTQDSNWNTILSSLVVQFKANTSTRLTGSYGTAQTVGYYQLTTAFQSILVGTNVGTGAYSANDFLVEAKANTITGSNGAKGSVLQFRITLTDEHANEFYDSVASGTNVALHHFRATGLSIAAPTCSVVTGF